MNLSLGVRSIGWKANYKKELLLSRLFELNTQLPCTDDFTELLQVYQRIHSLCVPSPFFGAGDKAGCTEYVVPCCIIYICCKLTNYSAVTNTFVLCIPGTV